MKCRYCQDKGYVVMLTGEAGERAREIRVRCSHPRRWSMERPASREERA